MANRESRRHRGRDEKRHGAAETERQTDTAAVPAARTRTPPREYLGEVRQELKKVAWPRRQEVVSYTIVVLVATAVLTALVFAMDFVFGRLVFAVFGS